MKIKVLDDVYDLDPHVVASARGCVVDFLDIIERNSKDSNIPGYYDSAVIMMYVISTAILKTISTSNIRTINDDIRKKEEQKKAEVPKQTESGSVSKSPSL